MAIYPMNRAPILPGLIQQHALPMGKIVAIDVGCSGGVSQEWAPWLPWMQIYAIDPLAAEIDRLKREAPLPQVEYFDGWVVGPEPAKHTPKNWFSRASTVAAYASRAQTYEQQHFNAGAQMVHSERRFTLDQFRADNSIPRVDFLKVDTDGADWSVLAGAPETLERVVAVHVEAAFATGTGAVFREIDALMDEAGFYLAGLAPYTYSRAALPMPFTHELMADTIGGATSWGDFLYLRDVVGGDPRDVLRLAVLAEAYNLADIAAEALASIRSHLEVTPLLDGLVRYSAMPDAVSYDEMLKAFAANPEAFVRR